MNITAIIPIRFRDCCHDDGSPKYLLRNRPLWEWTYDQALEAAGLDNVIVAYDDDRFEAHIPQENENVSFFKRPQFLSKQGVTSLDVVAHVAKAEVPEMNASDYCMLLEITHPLRPAGLITRVIEIAAKNPADSLVTVVPEHYNYWKQEKGGARRIVGSGDDPGIEMYRELIGICSLFKTKGLLSGNPFGQYTDLIPIDRFWSTIDVRNEEQLWVAEKYLEMIDVS